MTLRFHCFQCGELKLKAEVSLNRKTAVTVRCPCGAEGEYEIEPRGNRTDFIVRYPDDFKEFQNASLT